MKLQEHEYKARDKTVQKMSRDGLREKNLRSKKEKRITGREADEKKTAGHREQELDFGKVRKTHAAEETVEEEKEGKHRLQSRHAFLEQEEVAEAEEIESSEMSNEKAGGEKSPSVSRSRLRKESIRGHPEQKFERDSEITESDKQNQKKKMVTAYAAKEQKRYHEKSMEDFREEIKGKTKREQIRKEQKKSKSRLSFEDESKGVIPGSGMAKRGASAVSETVSDYGQKKVREDTDDNAALDAADQMEFAGESLARKSIYVRERLKENRQRNNRLKESVLEETEKSRLQFGTSASDEAKRAVQKEAEQKKQSALKKLLQKKALSEAVSGCETGKSCERRSACKCTAIYRKSQSCGQGACGTEQKYPPVHRSSGSAVCVDGNESVKLCCIIPGQFQCYYFYQLFQRGRRYLCCGKCLCGFGKCTE